VLILANIVVFFCTSNGLVVRREVVDQWALKGTNFDFVHLLTSMFMHGSLFHLLGNMWFLYLFGFAVEGRMRTWRFVPMYLLAGICGSLAHHLVFGVKNPNIPSLGASGAIMGVVGAAMLLFPYAKISVLSRWSAAAGGDYLSDWAMWVVGLYYVGFDLIYGLLGIRDGVAHFAHLGGAVAGLLIPLILCVKRDSEFASEVKAQVHEAKTFKGLGRMQLAELYRHDPTKPALVFEWVRASLFDPRGVNDECREAWNKHKLAIFEEEPIREVAMLAIQLSKDSSMISLRDLSSLAPRLEKSGDYVNAITMYDMISANPNASAADRESALFRSAMVAESALQDFNRAWAGYQRIMNEFPMGAFAQQANTRLWAIHNRFNTQPK
jgi:membrane associated rhomboid family serine protease